MSCELRTCIWRSQLTEFVRDFFVMQEVTFYGSQFIDDRLPEEGTEVKVQGLSKPAIVNSDGMHIYGNDGKKVSEKQRVQ